MSEENTLNRWRRLGRCFHTVSRLEARGSLSPDFTPADLEWMVRESGISNNERSVLRFLLHTWNGYDNPFELRDILGWDNQHLRALADWITGKADGDPVQYF